MADSYLDLSLDSQNVKIKLTDNGDGTYSLATSGGGTSSGLTDAELRAADVKVTLDSEKVDVSQIDNLYIPNVFKTVKGSAIGSIATVWTPASGKKVRLMGGSISVSAAVSVLFEDNAAGTDVFQTPILAINTPYNFDLGNGKLLSAINNVLKATSSAAANLTGTLYGLEE